MKEITGNSEILGGRVKTISFQTAAGLLFDRRNQNQKKEITNLKILPIDMVICNSYSFEKIIKEKSYSLNKTLSFIDIGGLTMIRAAAKNYRYVTVIVDPKDYKKIVEILKSKREIPERLRLILAQKAFAKTAKYDEKISNYFKNVISRKIKNRRQS